MKGRRAILIIEDERSMCDVLRGELEPDFDVATAETGRAGLSSLERDRPDVVVLDLDLPDMHGLAVLREMSQRCSPMPAVVVTIAENNLEFAVEAVRSGAYDYLVKPFALDRLRGAIERAHEHARLLRENTSLRQTLQDSKQGHGLLGTSKAIQDLRRQVEKVADSRGTVLLTGESGTGKELAARAIHEQSVRAAGPYIRINCAAIPESLLESELFGHEKGAFSHAPGRREGMFELASGGTLLLDEVSEVPSTIQARLLRVLQEREVVRIGGKTSVKVDVRIVATTNKDLRKLVREGQFKEELYYRLSVIPIDIPPLRDRKEDIPVLARTFIERACAENGRPLMKPTPAAIAALMEHPWPGNVRELQHQLERAVILNEGAEIDACDIDLEDAGSSRPQARQLDASDLTLREMEKELILRRLSLTGGNRTRAALMLGISVRTLRNKINQYRGEGIKIPG